MANNQDNDPGIDILLDLDGEEFHDDRGYWTKFEVRLVEANDTIPHGIRYSLTFHDKNGERIIGFDNAHGIKPKRKKFQARKTTWDHKHNRERTTNYEFNSQDNCLRTFGKKLISFSKTIRGDFNGYTCTKSWDYFSK